MRIGKGLLGSVAAGLLIACGAQPAAADSITVTINTPVITDLGNGTFEWAYGTSLSQGSEIDQGSFFEIVDFNTVLGVSAPTGWTPVVQSTSQVPGTNVQLAFNGLPADGPNANIMFQYNGPQIGSASASTDLGIFRIISPYGSSQDGAIIGNDYQFVSGSGLGKSQTNFGPTAVPVPLPAAAWGGMALMGLLAASRARKAMK